MLVLKSGLLSGVAIYRDVDSGDAEAGTRSSGVSNIFSSDRVSATGVDSGSSLGNGRATGGGSTRFVGAAFVVASSLTGSAAGTGFCRMAKEVGLANEACAFVGDPGGGDRRRPPVVTGSKDEGLVGDLSRSLRLFDRSRPNFHAGGSGFAAVGRGDSGFDSALSSQLALVGLHLRGSNVLEGLRLSNDSEGWCGRTLLSKDVCRFWYIAQFRGSFSIFGFFAGSRNQLLLLMA